MDKKVNNTIYTEIEIGANPERIWSILVDFTAYKDWNPFIVELAGRPIVGERLTARMKPEGTNGMTFTPSVLVSEPNREFRWIGRLFMPGLVDGEHRFALQPLPGGGTRFIQEERFSGILAPLFLRYIRKQTAASFQLMNHALKARSEQVEV